jgi:DNA-binding GntR family transcriptional regulator
MIHEYHKKKEDTRMEDLKNPNAWMKVYEHLRDGIIKGTYSPGERINEREIARLVGVSRTPTREALKVLEYEGFVNNITKKGAVVKKYSVEELDVIHRMLARLESLAVKMAVPKLSKEDIASLEKINRRLKKLASERRYKDYFVLSFEYHFFFPRATGSRELLDAISQLRKRALRFHYGHLIQVHNSERYTKDHQDIVDALKGKTKNKPEKLMEAHIERTRKAIWDYYRMFGF